MTSIKVEITLPEIIANREQISTARKNIKIMPKQSEMGDVEK